MSERPATVFIRGLAVTAIVGIHADERAAAQSVHIDIELQVSNARVHDSGAIADTVDYAEVAERVDQLVREKQFPLLETMAEQIADLLLTAYSAREVRVQVAKPRALDAARCAGVRITRTA